MGLLVRSPMSDWQALRTPKPEMPPFLKDKFRALLGALPKEWRPYFELRFVRVCGPESKRRFAGQLIGKY
jgi:hypothetical protein